MIKLRTQQIIIDMPRTLSEPWVHLTVQRVELDDQHNEINVVDRWGTIDKKLSAVALDIYTYFEVVPAEENQISVFAVADAIKEVAINWIAEKYNGTINIDGDVII